MTAQLAFLTPQIEEEDTGRKRSQKNDSREKGGSFMLNLRPSIDMEDGWKSNASQANR